MTLRPNPTITTLLLSLLLLGGLIVRLKDFQAPLADWHSFRQADTASVAQEYVKNGIDLLRPRYHDLSNIQSGQENPEGYRMVEFPLINGLVAYLYQHLPGADSWQLHQLYRLVNITLSLISAVFLYKILTKMESPLIGLLAAGVFLFLPFNIFYSRTVLPEIGMITATLAGIWYGLAYIDKPTIITFLLSGISLAAAALIKPIAVFFFLPLIGYSLKVRGVRSLLNWRNLLLLFAAAIPLYLWRTWIVQFPQGIPDSSWLLNGNNIRFSGAFFYWLFADRIGRLILGYWGTGLLMFGFLSKKKSNFANWWLLGGLLYLFIFATGNVQHDYYQIPIIPIISVLLAYGIHYLVTTTSFSKLSSYFLLLTSILFSVAFSWYHIRAYYAINHPNIVTAGLAVDQSVPANAKVIAPYMGDTAFLYQTNRTGWPIGFDIQDKIDKGASIYVTVNFDDEAGELQQKYSTIEKTSDYLILDLAKPIPATYSGTTADDK
jgi:hypothetical protein